MYTEIIIVKNVIFVFPGSEFIMDNVLSGYVPVFKNTLGGAEVRYRPMVSLL